MMRTPKKWSLKTLRWPIQPDGIGFLADFRRRVIGNPGFNEK